MKILYIITQADGGGAQKYVLTLAKHFRGLIAAGCEADQLFDDAQKAGLASFRLKHLKRNINPYADILAFFEIFRLVKKISPDIVHLNSSKAGFLGSIAAKLAGKKTVFTAHGFFYFNNAPWLTRLGYTFLERLACLFRDKIIAVSQADADLARTRLKQNDRKLAVIYNGIKFLDFVPRLTGQAQLQINGGKIVCGSVAQYYRRKGFDILIEAAALLPAGEREKLAFVLIGEGPDRNRLQNLIAKKNLQATILLKGFIPQASRLLKAFDIFILPSRREGFPFAILEAMQAGLPIIACEVGGVREALGDAGLLVPPENPKALAGAIAKLLSEPGLSAQLSESAQARSKMFLESRMLLETEKIYQNLILR